MVGSVHAVTEAGDLGTASASASQLGPYVSGAGRLILVVGSQKVVRDLDEAGASHAIVYGVFPAAAPLIVVGGTLAGAAGARQEWPMFGTALVVVAVGVGAAFAGPAGAWAVAGVGLFFAVLGYTAATAWLHPHVTVGG